MNKKLNLILFIIAGLFLGALISRNGTLAMMTIPFLAYIGIGLRTAPGEINLKAERALVPLRSEGNEPIRMTLRLENHGEAVPLVRVIEPCQSDLTLIEGSLDQRFTLPLGASIETGYSFQAPRGRYSWESVHLIASDSFGLFDRTLEIQAEAQTLVWPAAELLKKFRFQPHPTIRTAGPYLSRLPGSGVDFWGVREYQPGDSMRTIHWRLSARHPQAFFSIVHEREEMADIGLLLDARAMAHRLPGTDQLFDASVQAAAALAKYLLSAGNRVSMLVLNDRLMRVYPGYGKHQLARILDQLAACTPGERVTFNTLKYLPARLFPVKSVIVLISPLLPEDHNFIHRLHSKGYQVLVVSPNPVAYMTDRAMENSPDELAIRTAALERKALLWRIQKKGIRVVDWNINRSLSEALHATRMIKLEQ